MMSLFRFLRRKAVAAGLVPRSKLAHITVYFAGIVILLLVAQELFSVAGLVGTANSLGSWAGGLAIPAALFTVILAFRFVRQRVLWRLRNRLIVTYVFIGLIPVILLLAMFALAGYSLAGQFATFLANADLHGELSSITATSNEVSAQIAAELRSGITPDRIAQLLRSSDRLDQQPNRTISFWYGQHEYNIRADGAPPQPALPAWMRELAGKKGGEFQDVTFESGRLRLVALRAASINGDPVTALTSEVLNDSLLARLARGLGSISIYGQGGPTSPPLAHGGSLPPPSSKVDFAFGFVEPLQVHDWATGADLTRPYFLLSVSTRNSLLYDQLGETLSQSGSSWKYSEVWLIALFVAAIVFAVIEVIAAFIGFRLSRTITLSVSELYRATQSVNRGDFSRRIPIRSTDQLAALGGSFNSMTESLQKLLAEQKEKQRIESELAIAQEVQNQLFPHQAAELQSLEVYGVCRPARTVSGDYYDFLPLAPEQVVVAVGDISGKGISAALLMATLHSAVRSFLVLHSREVAAQPALAAVASGSRTATETQADVPVLELAPAQWLELLNSHLYRSTPASKYATLFLGEYNGATRTLTYSNGGHLAPLVLSRTGEVRRLEAGGMVVGLFDGMQYEQESVKLSLDDTFVAYSDGITEPENEYGEFGEQRLIELIREHAGQPLERIAEEVLAAVTDWIGGEEQPDDMTIVLARAR
jgi:sigma-B regulation protein RsbU (phosphoserine phosphatase)